MLKSKKEKNGMVWYSLVKIVKPNYGVARAAKNGRTTKHSPGMLESKEAYFDLFSGTLLPFMFWRDFLRREIWQKYICLSVIIIIIMLDEIITMYMMTKNHEGLPNRRHAVKTNKFLGVGTSFRILAFAFASFASSTHLSPSISDLGWQAD